MTSRPQTSRPRPQGRRAWVVRGRPGQATCLPLLVSAVLVLVCGAAALAGVASVSAVAQEQELLQQSARLSDVVADAARVEALVAQLGDLRTNPTAVPALRLELERAAGRLEISGADVEQGWRGHSDVRKSVSAAAPRLGHLLADFTARAGSAAEPQARLEQGQLLRGSLDALYPALRTEAARAQTVLLADGERHRKAWARAVVVGLGLTVAGLVALAGLVLGPVRRRLTQQRVDAERLALLRHRELVRTTALARATTAVLRHDEARVALCAAAREVTGGALGSLWEDDGQGDLVCTAATETGMLGLRLSLAERSITARVFHTARPLTVTDLSVETDVDPGTVEALARACGRPISGGIWTPVVAAGRCLAVLAIGLPARSSDAADREADDDGPVDAATLAELQPTLEILADEAAVALERQELTRRLAALGGADPATGASTRVAWDDVLPRAVYTSRVTGAPVSAVMLRLDGGTPAGAGAAVLEPGADPADPALRRGVAAWQRLLRPGDTVTRFGADVVAVVLPGRDLAAACRLADDLRHLVPAPRTCSAGVAQLHGTETAAGLTHRLEQALARARAEGGDRATQAEPAPVRPRPVQPRAVMSPVDGSPSASA